MPGDRRVHAVLPVPDIDVPAGVAELRARGVVFEV